MDKYGEEWKESCKDCVKYYPGHAMDCLGCGKKCVKVAPCNGREDCGKNPAFVKCHEECMSGSSHHDECTAYEAYGEKAKKGCESCTKYYPEHAGECMGCGKQCLQVAPCNGPEDCGNNPEFVKCHKECMSNKNDECAAFGNDAKKGCELCVKFYPGRASH